jgi:translation initiation factor IF-3
MFRGREQSRPEMGYKLLARLAEDLAEVSMVEFAPKQDGRNMVMVLAPNRRKSEAIRTKQVVRDKTDKPSDTE